MPSQRTTATQLAIKWLWLNENEYLTIHQRINEGLQNRTTLPEGANQYSSKEKDIILSLEQGVVLLWFILRLPSMRSNIFSVDFLPCKFHIIPQVTWRGEAASCRNIIRTLSLQANLSRCSHEELISSLYVKNNKYNSTAIGSIIWCLSVTGGSPRSAASFLL